MAGEIIVSNRARCKKCNTLIESLSVHAHVSCGCQSIFVDGGNEYLRRGGSLENIQELSMVIPKPTQLQKAVWDLLLAFKAGGAPAQMRLHLYAKCWQALEAESQTVV